MVQKVNYKKYWFEEEDLLKPIDWDYFNLLSERIKDALELYMRGGISIGKSAEIAGLSYVEFDRIRGKSRIPIRILID